MQRLTDAEVTRLLRRPLPVLTGRDLPHIGWFQPDGHRPLRKRYFEPVPVQPQVRAFNLVKPDGGLWTAPILAVRDGDQMLTIGTTWSMVTQRYHRPTPVYRLKPRPSARVALLHTRGHLDTLQRRYPLPQHLLGPMNEALWNLTGSGKVGRFVDWHAAAREFDAVWITSQAAAVLDTWKDELALWQWTYETVLWLRPAFHVMRRTIRGMSRIEYDERTQPPGMDLLAKLMVIADAARLREDEDERVDA